MSPGSRLLVAVGFLVVGLVNEGTKARAQRPAFRAGVDLVSLSVTVTDPSQRHVTDLNREDFVVMEDGVAQNIMFFERTGVPLALALVIDTSASMDLSLATAQEAAIGFIRRMGPADLATIVDFDSRVRTAQRLTSDRKALENAIHGTVADGSTALYNAVYITLKELSRSVPQEDRQVPHRRAIIVLSDGEDTSSLVSFDEVLDLAARSGVAIYAIGLGLQTSDRRNKEDGQFVLRRLAQQTGGRAFFPQDVNDLAAVYGDIREELASQYLLAYESTRTRDGRWRPLMVRVNRANVTVRTKQGYFAPSK